MIACKSDKSQVLVCYGHIAPDKIKNYVYVILEPKHYSKSDVAEIKKNNSNVVAYISLGEVNENAVHYNDLKKLTLGKNKLWNSHYIDFENPRTSEILDKIVSRTIKTGYDGMFLDNLDNFGIYGPQKSQRDAAINYVKALKSKNPNKIFIQNAGLSLLPETAKYVDAVLIESVATSYDFKNKKYQLSCSEHFKTMMNTLKDIHRTYNLPIIVVEYADTQALHDKVVDRIISSGFSYFIGTINLQTVPNYK